MNRIKQLFEQKKREILSVYFTAGFPEVSSTSIIIKELERNGIDLIEIGIPFSDPLADGPVIQNSGTIALRNGMSLKLLFSQLTGIRDEVNLPLIMMGYLNPIMQYGFQQFCEDCNRVGVDGVIIPDLPFSDYLEEYKPIADQFDLKMIMLITPETSDERIQLIDNNTDGFIYMVSSASTTGTQKTFDTIKEDYFEHINALNLKNPRLIGFGISNKSTLDLAWKYSNGAIVGSKFIQLLKEKQDPRLAVQELIKGLVEAG